MKNETKEIKTCEECGNEINEVADSRGYIACEKCGLVVNDNHIMGYGINGLINYAKHNKLQEHIEMIHSIVTFQGLREGRLFVAKLERNL